MNLANQLVKYHLEINSLMPSEMDWPLDLFKENPPRYIRLKRLYALKKALQLDEVCMQQFLQGEFITNEHYKVWEAVYEIVKEKFNIQIEDYLSINTINPDIKSLSFLFHILFDFKKNHFKLLNTGSGVLTASDFYLTPMLILKNVAPKLQTDIHLIDEILDLIINPTRIAYSEKELNALFDYPLDDLAEIDMDWM